VREEDCSGRIAVGGGVGGAWWEEEWEEEWLLNL